MVKANATEEFNPTKASKAQISELKKPEVIATIVDDYERPQLEKYQRFDFEKPTPEKSTPVVNIPDQDPPEVKLTAINPKVNPI